jgi:4-amino-4-deoxy-L-arabinose transferase-like glycosyltransferase
MRAGPLAVLSFGALLLLPGLGRLGALDSTDARYLAIGREMWAHGDWLMPRLGGAPHLDKPPLTYWGASLGYALFGPTEFAGRCVQQLALLATALLVYRAAKRWADPSWALPASLVFLSFALPFVLSRGLATDLFQLLFVSCALVALCDAAVQRRVARVAAAGAWLGVSMLAKGPIALLVAASIWAVFAACVRGRAALPARGVALGAALFAAIGLPWFALLAFQHPGILDWFVEVQLVSRVTGSDRGHLKDATYLLRVAPLALLPWTPIVALALFRLRPRGRLRDADPVDVFVLAWAIVPVLLFSLFPTKLGSYIAPAFPGAALAVARAGSRGLLDDRRARCVLGVCTAIVFAVAFAGGALLVGESGGGFDLVKPLPLHGDRAALVFGALLLAIGAAGAFVVPRIARLDAARAHLATAVAAGTVFALGFHAIADAMPTLRNAGRLVASVPGARVVEFSMKPSLFFYADADGGVSLATVKGVVGRFVDPAEARRLTLTRDDALALLRESAPTFALINDEKSDALAAEADLEAVSRTRRYVLLANPAARSALTARATRSP